LIPFVRISVGEGGLPQCARCALDTPALSPRASADIRTEIENAVGGQETGPGPNIMLGGMEAFAHPDLPGLVAYAAQAGAVRIALQTGGGSLTAGENAPGALHVGVRHVEVRYIPGSDDDEESVTASASRNDAALSGVRAFVSAAEARGERVAVSAVVPVCRHTAPRLARAIAELADAGVGAVRLSAPEGDSHGPGTVAHVIAACDTGVVNGIWVDVAGIALPETHQAHAVTGAER
jgi:hypothetical protein